MEFAEMVKIIRTKSFMSQNEFSDALGVSFDSVSRWENGKTMPNFKALKKLNDFCVNKPSPIVYPENTIVLDKYLLKIENSTTKRFTIGHEIAHNILSKVTASHSSGRYNTIFDKEMTYTIDEMKEQFSMCEYEANKVAAALLMPKFLLKNTLKRVMNKDKFPMYGEFQMLPEDSYKQKMIAEDLGVAPITLQIRLKACKMLEQNEMSEYLKIMKLKGSI